MANKSEIAVRLVVNDDGSVTVKQFGKNAEESLDKLKASSKNASSSLDIMKDSWVKMTAVAAATMYAFEKACALIDKIVSDAARYETLGVVMKVVGNNAGYSNEQMDKFAGGLEKTGISMSSARDALTRMTQAQLDLNQSSKLARVAQDAAVIGNINSSDAFKQLVFGIQSAQVEVLRTIGINVNFENSYAKVAKQTGRTADSFSEVEKATIRMNAVLDSGKNIAGTYEAAMSTAGKQMLSLSRYADNIKVGIGLAFTPALAEIIETITGALINLSGELNNDSKNKIQEWGVNFRIVIIDVEAEIQRLAMLLDLFGGAFNQAKMGIYGIGAAIGYGPSVERFEAAAKAYSEYEERYKKSEKALEDLAMKQIKLEYSLTDAGKESARATEAAAEKKRLANAAAIKAAEAAAEAEKKHQQAVTDAAKTAKKTAEEDVKFLKSRLSEYEQYYDKLQSMMEKNIENERKHLDELKSLRLQRTSLEQSTASMITQITGSDKNVSAQQRYESGRSALNQQYDDALNLSGQDRIKALEEYKQAVLSLQQQFQNGVPGIKDIFGNPDDIISAKTIAADALSDIERATQNQRNELQRLEEEKQKQIEADRQWGQVLQEEMQRAQNEMSNLKNTIADITAQIENMQKTITIKGDDQASAMIESITARIDQLHDKTITIKTRYVTESSSSSWWGSSDSSYGFMQDTDYSINKTYMDSYADGTDYVPRTGPYLLHQGEAVVTADENKSGRGGVNINGDIIIHVPESAAAGTPEDWRYITRQYIVPELRQLQS